LADSQPAAKCDRLQPRRLIRAERQHVSNRDCAPRSEYFAVAAERRGRLTPSRRGGISFFYWVFFFFFFFFFDCVFVFFFFGFFFFFFVFFGFFCFFFWFFVRVFLVFFFLWGFFMAIAMVLDGHSRLLAAQASAMDRQTLRDWVHRYNADGLAGLADRPRPGRQPRLAEAQRSEVASGWKTALTSRPMAWCAGAVLTA